MGINWPKWTFVSVVTLALGALAKATIWPSFDFPPYVGGLAIFIVFQIWHEQRSVN